VGPEQVPDVRLVGEHRGVGRGPRVTSLKAPEASAGSRIIPYTPQTAYPFYSACCNSHSTDRRILGGEESARFRRFSHTAGGYPAPPRPRGVARLRTGVP